jgi:hypothetical protein
MHETLEVDKLIFIQFDAWEVTKINRHIPVLVKIEQW